MQLQQMGCCRLDPLHIHQPILVSKSTWCTDNKVMSYCSPVTSPDCHVRLQQLLHVSEPPSLPSPSYHLIRTTTCIHLTLSRVLLQLHFPSFSFPQKPPGKLLMEKAQGRKGEGEEEELRARAAHLTMQCHLSERWAQSSMHFAVVKSRIFSIQKCRIHMCRNKWKPYSR